MNELKEIQTQMGRLVSHMESERDGRVKTNKEIADIHGFIFGNVKNPVSVNVRLDRLEQKQENRKWFIGTIATVVGGLGLDRIIQFLKGY